MTDKLDMMVEKELQGRKSRSKSSFTPRPTSTDPSMTATPSDAPSSAQPLTLLVPWTSAITLAPTPCTLEMSKYAVFQGAVEMPSSSTTSTCPQLDGEHIFVSFSTPNILQTNENKAKDYYGWLEELKDVEVNSCAAAKTSMESKENNMHCVSTTPLFLDMFLAAGTTLIYGSTPNWAPLLTIGTSRGRLVIKKGKMMRWCTCVLHQVPTFECSHGFHLSRLWEDKVVIQFWMMTLSRGRLKYKKGEDDMDIPCMDTTTSPWSDVKTYFKYGKLVSNNFVN
jgi:hypothetical protein